MTHRHKAYVDPDNKATIYCPECGTTNVVDASPFKDKKPPVITVKCPCGPRQEVELEFRSSFRKEAHLEGLYRKHGGEQDHGAMKVNNLSMTGIGFTTLAQNRLEPGDRITVKFVLDDTQRSLVEKTAEVRSSDGNHVGARFLTPKGREDAALGFYLRP